MTSKWNVRGRALVALLLFLCACRSAPPYCWSRLTDESDCPSYTVSKLSYCQAGFRPYIGLELFDGPKGEQLYAYLTCRHFPWHHGDPDHTEVTLTIGEEATRYIAERLEGGQKLLLPDDARTKMMAALENEQEATLSIQWLSTTYPPI